MAGRPRKNSDNPAKRGRKAKSVVEEVIIEAPVVEEVIAEEIPAVETEEPVTEIVAEETVAEAVKPAEEESKPKRKYTRRAKPVEETPVVVEEEPKPKRKYTRHVKPVEVLEETVEEIVSAPKLSAYIQGAGAEISFEELSETAVKLSGVKSPKTVNLYIKPYEDDGVAKVYYVVDNKAGHFNLFN